jgi:CheY-like chemotaxis protein
MQDRKKALAGFVSGNYDAAIVDLGMPGMPGDEVAREMRRIDPYLGMILITGWELQESDPRRSVFVFQMQKLLDNLAHILNTLTLAIELHDMRLTEKG